MSSRRVSAGGPTAAAPFPASVRVERSRDARSSEAETFSDSRTSPSLGIGPRRSLPRATPQAASRGSDRTGLLVTALPILLALAACGRGEEEQTTFPEPQRPVAPIVSSRYLNEDARDSVGEAERVMELADIGEGMYVADIGAGEGYYTVRLSPLVGERGRVLAQDIVPETIHELARRVHRERLDNVALKLGQPNNPLLPEASFDRVLLIHMYHEIPRPSEFLWNLRGSLKRDGRVVVVDADRPTDRHGTPTRLLVCEFNAVGYELTRFERLDSESYFAQFEPRGPRPLPQDIPACTL